MRKRWRISPLDAGRVAQLEQAAGVPSIVAQLLLSRGVYDPATARSFLEAKLSGLREPDLLPGAAAAADLIHAAIQAKRKIVIYGDYDADGMTGSSLLLTCLKLLGADCLYYVPDRLSEGYGLNHEALKTLAERGANMVVSVDCGITSVEEAETARKLGIELIITDHHELADSLPNAAAVVHPRLPGTNYPFGGLCGAGVALKLAWAICQRASGAKRVSENLRNFLLSAVGLAAIGTVADMVPLIDENRILVRHGLTSLKFQPSIGLQALMQVCKLTDKTALSSEDIAFAIAPRLNAAGRFGQAKLAVELLTTDNPTRAQQLAEYIHELNNSRESIERSIQLAAAKQVKDEFDPENDGALVLAGKGWHAGVIGLVAGRLAEKYQVPVVLIALDTTGSQHGVGSARSPGRLNLHQALNACSEHLLGHGGHAAAAGLRIEEANIAAFRNAFLDYAAAEAGAVGAQGSELRIDGEGPFCQLTAEVVRQIESLAPFGMGNPRPVLCASGVTLMEPPKRIGGGERHLSLKLSHLRTPMRCVAFGFGDDAEAITAANGPLDVAYKPVINEFRGMAKVEIQLVDWRVSELSKPATAASSIAAV
ncbi:Single-stranded-DNA-specific exonuclease RecJ [Anatilimnocola aggregata]|uniref:Single-stranded-DNA-specific exonuclease RecJ n=1 Tax=Anatilimnocola aggregata TaxID=2528021 RepID=A0A517YAQ0_9BACT|nr:single-stranded-DNA-specific exonuclease RecJ [Anatilimnocola aggregata]QDU27316.1 Single-stranded-DNA-specific exonuclease RecJ [Anatilimnocola aggregata]